MTRDIRATRDRLGLTTAQLAQLVGVKNRTAHRWLANATDVPEPVWRLLELGEALEMVRGIPLGFSWLALWPSHQLRAGIKPPS